MGTVRVKHPIVPGNDLGFVCIVETDFDPSKHELFDESEAPPPVKPVEAPPPQPALLDVMVMTTPELREALDARGIKYHAAAKKAELQSLLTGSHV